jgi:hypothetical protein
LSRGLLSGFARSTSESSRARTERGAPVEGAHDLARQLIAVAEEHGDDVDLKLVEQPGLEVLAGIAKRFSDDVRVDVIEMSRVSFAIVPLASLELSASA